MSRGVKYTSVIIKTLEQVNLCSKSVTESIKCCVCSFLFACGYLLILFNHGILICTKHENLDQPKTHGVVTSCFVQVYAGWVRLLCNWRLKNTILKDISKQITVLLTQITHWPHRELRKNKINDLKAKVASEQTIFKRKKNWKNLAMWPMPPLQ